MLRRPPVFLLLYLAVFSASLANAQESNEVPGPKVGDRVKNFKLPDQDGEKRELAALLKQGPVAIVFHRSAEW